MSRYKQLFIGFSGVCAALAILATSSGHSDVTLDSFTASLRARQHAEGEAWDKHPDTNQYKVARRLKKRLALRGQQSPALPVLVDGLRNHANLLNRSTSVTLAAEDGVSREWLVHLDQHPDWIIPSFSLTEARYDVREDRIAQYVHTYPFEEFPAPIHATVSGITPVNGMASVEDALLATDGYRLQPELISSMTAVALKRGTTNITIPVAVENAQVLYIDPTTGEETTLERIASGESNYTGSSYGRSANVAKAINEHVHNTVVLPGEEYSFNSTLDGPVTTRNGWSMAKVIFNGADLEMAPGGGICQASTTLYRAILNAGLPVTDRKPHSLYVQYYEAGGVGIDATIFPGKQDLAFINTTEAPIFVQSYTDDDKNAVVHLYGVDDGRDVTLEGPYFSTNAPDDVLAYGERPLYRNEIAWVQNISFSNGENERNVILSRYKHVPHYIHTKYKYEPEPLEDLLTHAAAHD